MPGNMAIIKMGCYRSVTTYFT